jgi:hypothetical protein
METTTYVRGEMMSKSGYSVWVGGIEVNDYYMTEEQAERLAKLFKMNGHDDVHVRKEADE